jgi:hypothetical protein
MSTKYWIKLYHEILHDPKMGRMPDHLWRRVIELFLIAGEHNRGGVLPPLTEIAWALRLREEQLETEMIELQKTGILSSIDGVWIVTKFAERQEPMDKAEYMRRKREQQQKDHYYGEDDTLQDSYQSVTNSNADTDTDIDIDINAADAALAPPEPPKKGEKKARKLPDKAIHQERGKLIEHFLARSKVRFPNVKTNSEIKAAQKLWWGPADQILEITNKDPAIYRTLIDAAVEQMDRENLHISNLNSILNIVIGLEGKSKRASTGASSNGYTPA